MKNVKCLIIVLFLCLVVGCSKSNDRSYEKLTNNSNITDSNEKTNNQQEDNSITESNKKNEEDNNSQDDLQSNLSKDEQDNKKQKEDENYFPADFGKNIEYVFEFEIITISKTSYNVSSDIYNGDVYLAKVKFTRYFNSDLVKKTSYQLNSLDQDFIDNMERINQVYDECMQSEYEDERTFGLKYLQEIAITDLDYYVEGGKYISSMVSPNVMLFDKTTNKPIGIFMDMIDICNTLRMVDEKLYLPNNECLYEEKNGTYGCRNAFNYMMPESLKLVDGMNVKDFIDWLVKAYNYKMEIFSKNNNCVKISEESN